MSSSSGNVSVPSAGIGVHHFHLWEFGEFFLFFFSMEKEQILIGSKYLSINLTHYLISGT
jgi:hypothetical protein